MYVRGVHGSVVWYVWCVHVHVVYISVCVSVYVWHGCMMYMDLPVLVCVHQCVVCMALWCGCVHIRGARGMGVWYGYKRT